MAKSQQQQEATIKSEYDVAAKRNDVGNDWNYQTKSGKYTVVGGKVVPYTQGMTQINPYGTKTNELGRLDYVGNPLYTGMVSGKGGSVYDQSAPTTEHKGSNLPQPGALPAAGGSSLTDPNQWTDPATGQKYVGGNGMTAQQVAAQNGVKIQAGGTDTNSWTDPATGQKYVGGNGMSAQQVAMQNGVANAQASGPAPQDSASGMAGANQFMPPSPPNNAALDAQLAEDPYIQQLMADRAEYTSVANQGKSLVDTFNQMIKQAGIPGINAELLNTKRIIDGTEDDIAAEVQAANGFATQSQILALAQSRNKQLIKNYNNLLDTKAMAMESINTMIGLASQDRTNALNSIIQKLGIDEKIMEHRDKMANAAQEGYDRVTKALGYKGLLDSLQGDPRAVAMAEKSLGLHPGGLDALAQTEQTTANLENLQKSGITTRFANVGGEWQDTQTGYAYKSPEDFQKKTGMTLEQADQKGLVSEAATKTGVSSYDEWKKYQQEGGTLGYNDYQTMDANRKAARSTTNVQIGSDTKEFDLRVKQAPSQVAILKAQGKGWGEIAKYFTALGIDPGMKEIDDALHRAFQSQTDYESWKPN